MDVMALARSVTELPRAGIVVILAAPQRAAVLWGEVERLAPEAGGVLDRFELMASRLEDLLATVEQEADDVREVIARVGAEVDEVARVVASVRGVVVEAAQTRSLAEEQVERLQGLVDEFEGPLRALGPVLVQASRELQPRHLSGIASLLDLLPGLVERIEPALVGMAGLAPEMEQVAERMDNVGQVVEGLPGAKALRRRGQARENGD